MLPLTIVLLVLNLFLVPTWLICESTVASGEKTVMASPGAITGPGRVSQISLGTEESSSQHHLSLNRKIPDPGAAAARKLCDRLRQRKLDGNIVRS